MNFEKAATTLGVEVAAIKAVAVVESRVSGFQSTGEPTILFERHIMARLLKEKGVNIYSLPSDLVNTTPGGYGKYSEQHAKLARAVEIDRDVALQSCSWGSFQIMGFHWRRLGYKSLQDFVNAMYKDEDAHLDCFVRFVQADPVLHMALKQKDWAEFARRYNGPNYAANDYDNKLAKAYADAK